MRECQFIIDRMCFLLEFILFQLFRVQWYKYFTEKNCPYQFKLGLFEWNELCENIFIIENALAGCVFVILLILSSCHLIHFGTWHSTSSVFDGINAEMNNHANSASLSIVTRGADEAVDFRKSISLSDQLNAAQFRIASSFHLIIHIFYIVEYIFFSKNSNVMYKSYFYPCMAPQRAK